MEVQEGVKASFDREELEAWLRGQPHQLVVAIATRNALRAVPGLETAFGRGKAGKSIAANLVLPVFRAVAASSAASLRPTDIPVTEATREVMGGDAFSADAPAYASADTVDTANAAYTAFYVAIGDYADDAANVVAAAAFLISLEAAYSDYEQVFEGVTASDLMAVPLWPDGAPSDVSNLWTRLSERLRELGSDWEVWVEWYEHWLEGHEPQVPLLRAWALLPEELWAIGPEAVNPVLRVLNEAWRDGGPEALQEAFRHNYTRYAQEAEMPDLFVEGTGPPPPEPDEPSRPSDIRHEVRPSADRAEAWKEVCATGTVAEPDDLIRALLGDVTFDNETVRIDADALKWLSRLTPVV